MLSWLQISTLYYFKVFWPLKLIPNNRWDCNLLFKHFVEKLKATVNKKKIPSFWENFKYFLLKVQNLDIVDTLVSC